MMSSRVSPICRLARKQEMGFLSDLLRRVDLRTNVNYFPRFIVYAATKELLVTVSKYFHDGFPHLAQNLVIYHGSSSTEHREKVHESIRLPDAQRIIGIFATSAFGTV